MLILNPRSVVLGSARLGDVVSVAIERRAARLAVEWTDLGPHAAFADVPEQRVDVRIVQEVGEGAPDGPSPGQSVTLSLVTSPAGGDSARQRLSASGVVTGCRYEVVQTALGERTRRTIDVVLVSPDGAADPVSIGPPGITGGEP